MALADIIGRIESDAGAEARALVDGAAAKVAVIEAEAEREGVQAREHALAAARHNAEARAATLRANARLAARDEMLSAKRALVERVLHEAEERLTALDDAAYTRLIARGIVRSARGGDVVRIAEADRQRLSALPAAVEAAAAQVGREVAVIFSAESADIAHGVMLDADRVSAEVSAASLVRGRRDELMALAAERLFPAEEA